jgi:allantoinase
MFDLVVKNAGVVRPNHPEVETLDIAMEGGTFVQLAPDIDPSEAVKVVDGEGLLAFPGVVDAHMHFGIYHPLSEDIQSESRAAATGGVTSGLSYMRTGQYYLNKGGSYADFFPDVLEMSKGRSYVDYAYHLAPMMAEHIDEIPDLIERFGVSSFKIFMFYGSHGLHGRSDDQSSFLMTPPGEQYDIAHFEFIMRGVRAAMDRFPDKAANLSVSLHCETAEIMRAYTTMVEEAGELSGLAAYDAARPPHSEGLAITIASYLAHETDCTNINLLHLSSAKAMDAAMRMAQVFPQIDFRREVTVNHLLVDVDTANGYFVMVNPPILSSVDVDALWLAVLEGNVDWVVSVHACCREEVKLDGDDPENVWLAKSGFGGTEFLLSGLLSEGTKRGLPPHRIAELISWNPAQRYGLLSKGTIEEGYDADLVLVDPNETFTVRAADSESTQEYSPLEGHELTGRTKHVFLRGTQIVENGTVIGEASGQYLSRPTS